MTASTRRNVTASRGGTAEYADADAFEARKTADVRRAQGVHYTPERDVLRVIGPLFLDRLQCDLEGCESAQDRRALQARIAGLTFLDPACGAGRFLAVALKALRTLEGQLPGPASVGPHQFFGIELDPEAAAVARAQGFAVVTGNALRVDWGDVLPAASFVFGNPPFVGWRFRSAEQRADLAAAWSGRAQHGVLDYATGWFIRAAEYGADAAFVCTNSITQGQQAASLWPPLAALDCRITFARRPFPWAADARVHVVVVGLSRRFDGPCRLFDGDREIPARSIGPYLLPDLGDVVHRQTTLQSPHVPAAMYGSMANDGGHLLVTEDQYAEVAADPVAAAALRPILGGQELLRGVRRWCLWMDSEPAPSPLLTARLDAVRAYRASSRRAATRAAAETPWRFAERRPQARPYVAVPNLSTDRRDIVPMAYFDPNTVCIAPHWCVPGAPLWLFALLQSRLFTAWVQTVAGRLKSDLRLSPGTVYNPFPFPRPSDALQATADAILAARDGRRLDVLYDPRSMPRALADAHAANDDAVDRCFAGRSLRPEERAGVVLAAYAATRRGSPDRRSGSGPRPGRRRRPPP